MTVTGAALGRPLVRVRRQCGDVLETQRPSPLLGRKGGPFLGAIEAPVVIVGTDAGEVERRLRAGELVCGCGGGLRPWGHARQRLIRGVGVLRPRRARCSLCQVKHVLLAVSLLLRRADGVEVIGAALRMKAGGVGHRPIAALLGRPASTVRGWLRAFARNAEVVRSLLAALLVQLDPLTGPLSAHAACSRMRWRCWVRARRRPAADSGCSARCRRGSWPPQSATVGSSPRVCRRGCLARTGPWARWLDQPLSRRVCAFRRIAKE